jgi:hypothetical protein
MRWAQLGYESTNFFHSVATQRYRKNFIGSIKIDDESYATLVENGPLVRDL